VRDGASGDGGHHGRVVLAATPLGDPGDASARLVAALGGADVIAAEDTRRLRRLARDLGVTLRGRVVSHYDAVEDVRVPALLDAARAGQTVLVVTDAGMPAVSDPGFRLVSACVAAGLPVSCLPGPSAVTTALVLSGLPCERFCFEGFAPRRDGERRRWLAGLVGEPRAVVFFESPRRLATTLSAAVEVLGADRPAAVCRELTKTYEQVLRGPLGELAEWAAGEQVRGEITVVLAGQAGPPGEAVSLEELVRRVRDRVAGGQRLKDAVNAVAEGAAIPKRDLYAAAVGSSSASSATSS
jgi:16S rRNA (cytidine1402-2'-O)-methyltransferase